MTVFILLSALSVAIMAMWLKIAEKIVSLAHSVVVIIHTRIVTTKIIRLAINCSNCLRSIDANTKANANSHNPFDSHSPVKKSQLNKLISRTDNGRDLPT